MQHMKTIPEVRPNNRATDTTLTTSSSDYQASMFADNDYNDNYQDNTDSTTQDGLADESSSPHPKNTLNEMTGDRFLYFTKSILPTSYPSIYSHNLRKKHGANKPPQLMALLIEFFTKSGMRVLDPFAGVGGTLIGASICSPAPRTCIGIEISGQWTDIYAQVLAENPQLLPQKMINGDCIEVMDAWLSGKSVQTTNGHDVLANAINDPFDFIVMDPPYNIHLKQTMSGKGASSYVDEHSNRRTDYNMRSAEERDLANLGSYESYLDSMQEVFKRCYKLISPGRYMAVIVRNAYQDSEYIFTHVDLARRAKQCGFVPKGEIIWHQSGTRLRPYGYPYSYVPNICHQYIVIVQKPSLPKSGESKKGRKGTK